MEKIKKQFLDGELDYLGAVDALKERGYDTATAEDMVEYWEQEMKSKEGKS